MQVFRAFSRLVDAIEALVRILGDLHDVQIQHGPALARLDALEVSRHQFEAECQGMLLKADGKLKAASNAEARERQLKRSYERDLDPFSEASGEETKGDTVSPVHDPSGEAEGMRDLRLALAPNSKEAAVMAKWSSQR